MGGILSSKIYLNIRNQAFEHFMCIYIYVWEQLCILKRTFEFFIFCMKIF